MGQLKRIEGSIKIRMNKVILVQICDIHRKNSLLAQQMEHPKMANENFFKEQRQYHVNIKLDDLNKFLFKYIFYTLVILYKISLNDE